jgi:hypothetical protein
MSKIILAGPFLFAWGLWHCLWAAGLLWLWAVPALFLPWYAFLYTAFLPLEIAGAVLNARHKDGRARTLSEIRQYLPVTQGRGPEGVGWKAFGYSGLIDAVIVGAIVYPLNPLGAAVVSSLLGLWLIPHFGWRGRVG